MTTAYMITTAILICVMIGIPLAIAVSRSDRASRIVLLGCDVLQTLPSFIYLVPFVMLFRVGDVSAIAAIATYALTPLVRYSVFGLRNIPVEANEAAV
jgi:glycine betaine/proline transport system permease protein